MKTPTKKEKNYVIILKEEGYKLRNEEKKRKNLTGFDNMKMRTENNKALTDALSKKKDSTKKKNGFKNRITNGRKVTKGIRMMTEVFYFVLF